MPADEGWDKEMSVCAQWGTYLVMEKDKTLPLVTTRVNLGDTFLSESTQTKNDRHRITPFLGGIPSGCIIETESGMVAAAGWWAEEMGEAGQGVQTWGHEVS